MASTTVTSFDPALKQIYRDSNLNNLTYKMRPLLGMLKKFEGFGGRNLPIPIIVGNPQGRSASFTNAQANATAISMQDFVLTRVSDYSIATIDSEVVEATRGDTMAFLSALKAKIDGAMNALSDAIETFLFRNGKGSLAQINAPSVADPMVLTLKQTEEITNFEVGMKILAFNDDAGTTNHNTPASVTIPIIDRGAGTITTAYDNSGGATNWEVDDYLKVQGDKPTGGTADVKIAGLAAWLPATAPDATAFFGVDRSVDSRYYGIIHDGSSDPLEETAIKAQSKVAREGGVVDCWLIGHAQMRRLIIELGAKKEYSEVAAQGKKGMIAGIGYRSVVIHGDHGPIDVVACNKAEATKGYMLTRDSWTLNTLGRPVKFLMEDKLRILRIYNADGYEVRLAFRGNLSSNAPGYNAYTGLPTP